MISDSDGDMGFMEAMLAMMAVSIVLMAYLGASSSLMVLDQSILDGFDEAELEGHIENGEFIPGFEGYIEEFVAEKDLRGMTVVVRIPGGFSEGIMIQVGSMDGDLESRVFARNISADHGCIITAVFEVTACA